MDNKSSRFRLRNERNIKKIILFREHEKLINDRELKI